LTSCPAPESHVCRSISKKFKKATAMIRMV
jgi:hypothetical protein